MDLQKYMEIKIAQKIQAADPRVVLLISDKKPKSIDQPNTIQKESGAILSRRWYVPDSFYSDNLQLD